MLLREVLKSITILSFFQLVFSKRSASNLFSYFYPDSDSSPANIDLGAAFTFCKNPTKRKFRELSTPSSRAFVKSLSTSGSFGKDVSERPWSGDTKCRLFSFNLNEVMKGLNKSREDQKKDNYVRSIENSYNKEELPDRKRQTSFSTTNEESKTENSLLHDGQNDIRPISLASLINVEALLLASGKIETEDENDLSAYILNDIVQQSLGRRNLSEKDNDMKDNMSVSLPLSTNISSTSLTNVEEELSWDNFIQSMQQSLKDLVESPVSYSPNFELTMATELVLKDATQKIETFMNDAASSISSEGVQGIIASVSRNLAVGQNADVFKTTMDAVVAAAEALAREKGVDVSDAASQARATTKYTAEFLQTANGVLISGYVKGGSGIGSDSDKDDIAKQLDITPNDEMAKPLFHKFKSVTSIPDSHVESAIYKASDFSVLSGAIYEDTIPRTHTLGHAIVANGTAADVVWMVSDTIGYQKDYEISKNVVNEVSEPVLIRTITVRGFDASDESVDREKLLYKICDAAPISIGDKTKHLIMHRGLMSVAKEVYAEISKYIDLTGPNHKIVLNGHSIGGAVSILVLLLLVEERGAEFVNEKFLRVFTFGSPPVTRFANDNEKESNSDSLDMHTCSILESLSLRNDMIYGYVQPWDPIVRMFSRIDPLYPLIGDLGDDGVTLYANGPPRTLRPITRAILESWENWPTFRDDYRGVMNQEYMSVGVQHLLMPDTGRYLTDRLVSMNVATFPIDNVLRVSSKELYDALESAFPLDTFVISLVPTAIRSFIHHFYPAYTDFEDYSKKRKANEDKSMRVSRDEASSEIKNLKMIDVKERVNPVVNKEIEKMKVDLKDEQKLSSLAEAAARFVLGDKLF